MLAPKHHRAIIELAKAFYEFLPGSGHSSWKGLYTLDRSPWEKRNIGGRSVLSLSTESSVAYDRGAAQQARGPTRGAPVCLPGGRPSPAGGKYFCGRRSLSLRRGGAASPDKNVLYAVSCARLRYTFHCGQCLQFVYGRV